MTLPEQITTVKQFHQSILKEKSSEFITQVYPVERTEECDSVLNSVRKKYFDATHHCYAFRILNDVQKYSDDGEPSGTAGIRILNAIDHFQLNNLLVIVIRYFGGTKLGVGPLGKAYYSSAFNAIDESEKVAKILMERLIIKTDFTLISQLYRIVSNYKGTIENTLYGEELSCQIIIPPKNSNLLKNDLLSISDGKIDINCTQTQFYL